MKTLERKEVGEIAEEYKLILDTETHHDHEIIKDEHGTERFIPALKCAGSKPVRLKDRANWWYYEITKNLTGPW